MSARDEFPRCADWADNGVMHGYDLTRAELRAMCDRIDTLTARYLDSFGHGERLRADLDGLRRALVAMKRVTGPVIVGDERWREAFAALAALVPDDYWGIE